MKTMKAFTYADDSDDDSDIDQALYTKLFFLLGILWIIDAVQVLTLSQQLWQVLDFSLYHYF